MIKNQFKFQTISAFLLVDIQIWLDFYALIWQKKYDYKTWLFFCCVLYSIHMKWKLSERRLTMSFLFGIIFFLSIFKRKRAHAQAFLQTSALASKRWLNQKT